MPDFDFSDFFKKLPKEEQENEMKKKRDRAQEKFISDVGFGPPRVRPRERKKAFPHLTFSQAVWENVTSFAPKRAVFLTLGGPISHFHSSFSSSRLLPPMISLRRGKGRRRRKGPSSAFARREKRGRTRTR